MSKYALVTGGLRGIGRGISELLLQSGYRVAACGTKAEADVAEIMTEMRKLGELDYLQANLGDSGDRDKLAAQLKELYPELHLLVNNAGIAPRVRTDMLEASEESFDEVLGINLKGPYFLTQKIANWMRETGGEGRNIINVTSISSYTSSVMRGDYCISKAGLSMMTQLFADRLSEDGIGVFEIRPGVIKTDMTAGVSEKYDKLIAEGLTPIKRWGAPSDIAKAIVSIAEGNFPFSTGEVINVDGGFHMNRLN